MLAGGMQRPLRVIPAAAFCISTAPTKGDGVNLSTPGALLLDALNMGPGFAL
jgi:hypothetical protein